MKTKSSSSHEDSRKVRPLANQDKETVVGRLEERNRDGRERSDERDTMDKTSMEWTDKNEKKSEKDITGKTNQEDIKKEFEISSEKESEKSSDMNRKKRENESHREEEEEEEFEGKESSWHKSYKGDAEIVI